MLELTTDIPNTLKEKFNINNEFENIYYEITARNKMPFIVWLDYKWFEEFAKIDINGGG